MFLSTTPFGSRAWRLLPMAITLILLLATALTARAAADLNLGDIAFTAYRSDNPDAFAFVLLKDVSSGTTITFTDNGWLAAGGFRSGEGTGTLTFEEGYASGVQITVIMATPPTLSASNGNNSGLSWSGSNLVLSASGDQVFAYQGPAPTADDPSSFLAAIQMNGAWDADATSTTTSAQPPVFSDSVNAIAISPEVDNGFYDGVREGFASVEQLRTFVTDSSRWLTDDSFLEIPNESFAFTTPPDLRVVKTDGEAAAQPGGSVQYMIHYSNLGSSVASGVILTETVPANTAYSPALSTPGWACIPDNRAGSTCILELGPLAGGIDDQVTFTVEIADPLPAGVSEITNSVQIGDDGVHGADPNPSDNSASDTTPINLPPKISAIAPQTQVVQYSDRIEPVLITASDSGPEPLSLSAIDPWPAGLTVSPATCTSSPDDGVLCSWTVAGQVRSAASNYEVRVVVGDGSQMSAPATITFQVEPEATDINLDVTNPAAIPVAMPGDTSPPFQLAATISEADDPSDGPGDQHLAGNISLAQVELRLLPVGPGSSVAPATCTTSINPGPVDPGSPFSYDSLELTCAFSEVPVNTYTVLVALEGGYYSGSEEGVLTIVDPSLGFTTGGGWFIWPGTADPATGYRGDRTNFGYTMQFHQRANNIKGSLLLIRHLANGSIYRLKSNALDGLALGSTNMYDWATFSGKATYQEPAWFEPVGNQGFLVYVEDRDQPGAGADRFWLEITGDNGYRRTLSMNQAAGENAATLQGGNIVVVHP